MADFLSKIVVSWQIFFQKFQTVLNQGAGWSDYTQKKDKLLANAMVEIINAIKCSDCPCH